MRRLALRQRMIRPLPIALLALLLVLAGCGRDEASTSGGSPAAASDARPEAEVSSSSSSSGSVSGPEVRIVKHAMGETKLAGTPKRIVSLYQGANDVSVALGIKPVGIVESWIQKPVYDYLKKDLGDVPQLGTEDQPNLEAVYELKPDVIFATKLRHEKIYDQLSKIAPTVMIDQVYDWKDTVRLFGETLNATDKTDALMAEWNKRVADFKAKMRDRLPIEATVANFRADHVRIYYNGYANDILKELGFGQPASQRDQTVWGVQLTSKEAIPDLNADVIFRFDWEDENGGAEKMYGEWSKHPLWQTLDAVKNDQVYRVDDVAWNFAGGYLSALDMLDELSSFYP